MKKQFGNIRGQKKIIQENAITPDGAVENLTNIAEVDKLTTPSHKAK